MIRVHRYSYSPTAKDAFFDDEQRSHDKIETMRSHGLSAGMYQSIFAKHDSVMLQQKRSLLHTEICS